MKKTLKKSSGLQSISANILKEIIDEVELSKETLKAQLKEYDTKILTNNETNALTGIATKPNIAKRIQNKLVDYKASELLRHRELPNLIGAEFSKLVGGNLTLNEFVGSLQTVEVLLNEYLGHKSKQVENEEVNIIIKQKTIPVSSLDIVLKDSIDCINNGLFDNSVYNLKDENSIAIWQNSVIQFLYFYNTNATKKLNSMVSDYILSITLILMMQAFYINLENKELPKLMMSSENLTKFQELLIKFSKKLEINNFLFEYLLKLGQWTMSSKNGDYKKCCSDMLKNLSQRGYISSSSDYMFILESLANDDNLSPKDCEIIKICYDALFSFALNNNPENIKILDTAYHQYASILFEKLFDKQLELTADGICQLIEISRQAIFVFFHRNTYKTENTISKTQEQKKFGLIEIIKIIKSNNKLLNKNLLVNIKNFLYELQKKYQNELSENDELQLFFREILALISNSDKNNDHKMSIASILINLINDKQNENIRKSIFNVLYNSKKCNFSELFKLIEQVEVNTHQEASSMLNLLSIEHSSSLDYKNTEFVNICVKLFNKLQPEKNLKSIILFIEKFQNKHKLFESLKKQNVKLISEEWESFKDFKQLVIQAKNKYDKILPLINPVYNKYLNKLQSHQIYQNLLPSQKKEHLIEVSNLIDSFIELLVTNTSANFSYKQKLNLAALSATLNSDYIELDELKNIIKIAKANIELECKESQEAIENTKDINLLNLETIKNFLKTPDENALIILKIAKYYDPAPNNFESNILKIKCCIHSKQYSTALTIINNAKLKHNGIKKQKNMLLILEARCNKNLLKFKEALVIYRLILKNSNGLMRLNAQIDNAYCLLASNKTSNIDKAIEILDVNLMEIHTNKIASEDAKNNLYLQNKIARFDAMIKKEKHEDALAYYENVLSFALKLKNTPIPANLFCIRAKLSEKIDSNPNDIIDFYLSEIYFGYKISSFSQNLFEKYILKYIEKNFDKINLDVFENMLLTQIPHKNPRHIMFVYELKIFTNFLKNQFDIALKNLFILEGNYGASWFSTHHIALSLLALNMHEEGLEHIHNSEFCNESYALNSLAIIYLALNRADEALESQRKLNELHPDSWECKNIKELINHYNKNSNDLQNNYYFKKITKLLNKSAYVNLNPAELYLTENFEDHQDYLENEAADSMFTNNLTSPPDSYSVFKEPSANTGTEKDILLDTKNDYIKIRASQG